MENTRPIFDAQELQDEFKSKILETLDFIKNFSEYAVLSNFYYEYRLTYGNMQDSLDEQSGPPDQRWPASMKIMYLQILFSCLDNSQSNRIPNENEFNKIDNLISDLFTLSEKYEMIPTSKTNLNSDEENYLSHSQAFSNACGKRYDIFEVQHHRDLLGCFEQEFKSSYNFSLTDLYSGISTLKQNFYFRFSDGINNIESLIDDNKIKYINGNFVVISIKNKRQIKKQLDFYINDVYTIELANLSAYTNWSKKFLNIFLVDSKYFKEFLEDITIENWNSLINRVKYRPLLKLNDNYYLLLEQRFYDNLDRFVIQGMCKDLPSKMQQSLRKRYTSHIEEIVSGYFKEILINSDVYLNNYYDYSRNKIIENDILAIYDNNIFIIEVKSGNFTPELAINDLASHKKSLHELIENANKQQNELEKCLHSKKKISIYNSNNKKKRIKKAEISLKDNTRIFKIIVTAESFNDIEARADKIKLISLSKDTLVLCLDDLRVYNNYFKHHPCYFIQYLSQRIKAIDNPYINLPDELYHLGMWIQYNDYCDHINRQLSNFIKDENINVPPHVMISGEDYMDELDNYYNNLYLKNEDVSKPCRKLSDEIEMILNYCENNFVENCTYLTNSLLNLDYYSMLKANRMIREYREFYKYTRNYKYGHISLSSENSDIEALYFYSIYRDKVNENVLMQDTYANMHLLQEEKALNVFLYYSNDSTIEKINIRILTSHDAD